MYCPATILSHCLLENTLKIHLLGIAWIWDFPQEDWSSCLRPAAAKLSPGVEEEEEVGGRCRCWRSSVTSKHKELAPSSAHHLRPPAPSWQGKNYTSQQAEGHQQPCKMESGFLGLAVTPDSPVGGWDCCGNAASPREGGSLVFALVARPSFESWNMLKAGLSELLFLVLFCFK